MLLTAMFFIQMPIASESCICGHVLSDIKSLGLGGKRYSGIDLVSPFSFDLYLHIQCLFLYRHSYNRIKMRGFFNRPPQLT